jgi:hypothetical protein
MITNLVSRSIWLVNMIGNSSGSLQFAIRLFNCDNCSVLLPFRSFAMHQFICEKKRAITKIVTTKGSLLFTAFWFDCINATDLYDKLIWQIDTTKVACFVADKYNCQRVNLLSHKIVSLAELVAIILLYYCSSSIAVENWDSSVARLDSTVNWKILKDRCTRCAPCHHT